MWVYIPLIGFLVGWMKKPYWYSLVSYLAVMFTLQAISGSWNIIGQVMSENALAGGIVTIFALALTVGLNFAGWLIGKHLKKTGDS